MTVTNTLNRYQYAGNGATTSFAFPPVFLEPADLGVVLFNTANQLAVTSNLNGGGPNDYTVSGVQDPNTGEYLSGASVVFNTAPPAGYTVTIYRNEPITQEVIFSPNGPLSAETLNTALDKSAMIEQQNFDNIIRAIRAPWMDPPPPSSPQMVLPSVASRAGMLVSFDSSGNVIVVPPGGSFSAGGVVANIAALRLTPGIAGETALLAGYYNAGDKPAVMYVWNAADSRADDGGLVISAGGSGRWNLDTLGKPFNVLDWGAYPNAASASDAQFTNWLAAIIANEAAGYIPAGHYTFAAQQYWDLSVIRTSGVKIVGDGSGNTLLDFAAVAASPNLLIGASADIFNVTLDGFAVSGAPAGVVLQLGHEDYSDPINTSRLGFDFKVNNNNASSSACAVEANSWLDGILWGEFNCAGHGDALRLRQVQFTHIGGSHSTADTGHHWTGGYSFGNTIIAPDIEGVGVCVLSDVTTASKNTYIGGQFVWTGAEAVLLTLCSNYFRFTGVNPGVSGTLISGAEKGSGIWEDQFVGVSPFGGVLVMPASGTDAAVAVAAASGQSAELLLQEQNGSGGQLQRWAFTKNNATESGGNAGSDFLITRYNDAGAALDNPLTIARASGIVLMVDGVEIHASWSVFGSAPLTSPPTSGHGTSPGAGGGTGAVFYDTAWDGGIGSSEYTIFDLVRALKLLGLIAA